MVNRSRRRVHFLGRRKGRPINIAVGLLAITTATFAPIVARAPAVSAASVVGETGQPDNADNPVLLGTSHVDSTSASKADLNGPLPQGSTAPLPMPPVENSTLPAGPAGPTPILSIPSPTSSSTSTAPSPLISYVNQFQLSNPYPYNDPPDNSVATSGTKIAQAFNACNTTACFEAVNFTNTSGVNQGSLTLCGAAGFTACADIQVLFDRVGGANRWVVSDEVYTPNSPGGALVIGVSTDSTGGSWYTWSLGKLTTGGIDAPRIGITSDKVILTINVFNACVFGSECSDQYVINKSQLYSLNGFNFDTFQGAGVNWQPVKETSNEQTTVFEAPDNETGNSGTMRTHYLAGAQGSDTWTTASWTIGNDPNSQFFASQPATNYTLDADSNEFEDAVYTGSVSWVDGNAQCGSGPLCPIVIAFNDDSNHKPTSVALDLQLSMVDGSSVFYPALSTTISSNNVLGALDYVCRSCNPVEYASVGTFELTTGASYSGGAYEAGNSAIAPDAGQTYHRWGDFNGCSYVPGSSPAQATCIGEFAYNGATQSEVITVTA